MSDERKLASIQTIAEICDIKGADKIQLAKILGWQCVVKKGEFKPGDKCVYFEIDSLLPFAPWSEFLRDKNNPDKAIRIKTRRFKGELSQGLALPTNILFDSGKHDDDVGTDVTDILAVKKWEITEPAVLAGLAKGSFPTHLIPKTDELRLQSYPKVMDEFKDLNVYITLKYDGSSFTCYKNGDEFGVCSRNMNLKENEDNAFWKIARKYDLETKLRRVPFNIAVQGEMFGPGIQKNKMGAAEIKLLIFNIYNIDERRYLDFAEMLQIINVYDLGTIIDVAYIGKFNFATIEQALNFANDLTYPNGTPCEGIVIRPLVNRPSDAIRSNRLSVKVISNKFLELYGE